MVIMNSEMPIPNSLLARCLAHKVFVHLACLELILAIEKTILQFRRIVYEGDVQILFHFPILGPDPLDDLTYGHFELWRQAFIYIHIHC
jgi:hypothetical protein